MQPRDHPAVTAVLAALTAATHHGAVSGLRLLDREVRTAADAAAALGVEVGAIANSLVFDAGGVPLLALTSGAHRADLDRLAAGGHPAAVLPTTFDDLVALTGGNGADFGAAA